MEGKNSSSFRVDGHRLYTIKIDEPFTITNINTLEGIALYK